MNEVLNKIYEFIKENYGKCLSVEIFVNCEGLQINTSTRNQTDGYSMRTIDGEFLPKKEV